MQKGKKKFLYCFLVWFWNLLLNIAYSFFPSIDNFIWILLPATMFSFLMMFLILIQLPRDPAFVSELWDGSPKFFIVLAILSLLYSAVSFLLCLYVLREGSPEIVDGVYMLAYDRGVYIRELSFAEYQTLMTAETRTGLNLCFAFSTFPMLFFSKEIKR